MSWRAHEEVTAQTCVPQAVEINLCYTGSLDACLPATGACSLHKECSPPSASQTRASAHSIEWAETGRRPGISLVSSSAYALGVSGLPVKSPGFPGNGARPGVCLGVLLLSLQEVTIVGKFLFAFFQLRDRWPYSLCMSLPPSLPLPLPFLFLSPQGPLPPHALPLQCLDGWRVLSGGMSSWASPVV